MHWKISPDDVLSTKQAKPVFKKIVMPSVI